MSLFGWGEMPAGPFAKALGTTTQEAHSEGDLIGMCSGPGNQTLKLGYVVADGADFYELFLHHLRVSHVEDATTQSGLKTGWDKKRYSGNDWLPQWNGLR